MKRFCFAGMMLFLSQLSWLQQFISDRPICKISVSRVMRVSQGDQVMVPCRVSANPGIVSFQWFFNSSDNKARQSEAVTEKYLNLGPKYVVFSLKLRKFWVIFKLKL